MREVDIRRYVKMLSEMNCSEIIIIEDTMSAPTEIELIDDLTAIFYESPEQDRRELLELNEIVSNVWMYEGDVAQGWAEHRTTEQWQAIFSDYGYVSEIEFLVGFDYHRLHGAPAVVMRFRYSPRTIRHA